MMSRLARLVFCGVVFQLLSVAAETPSCSIVNAAAAEQRVWLLCAEGKIYVSQDRGATWQPGTLPAGFQPRAVSFLDSRRGVVVGDSGTVMASEDGGKSWKQVDVPTKEHLRSVFFRGELGWTAGLNGVMLHSADGGRTWSSQESSVRQTLESVFFVDADRGWAVGWVGTMIRTVDGGKTWQPMKAPVVLWSLSSVYFRDAQNGWIVGFLGQILRSRDGGLTWVMQESPARCWLTAVRFDAAGRGWIAAQDTLLVSEDGGETWKVGQTVNAIFLRRLLDVNGSLWAIGDFSVVKQTAGSSEWETVERITFTSG